MARGRRFVIPTVECMALAATSAKTLLERIKTLYNETPGLSPDKIAPTVGQNSTLGLTALLSGVLTFTTSGKDYPSLHNPEVLGSGWPARHTFNLASLL